MSQELFDFDQIRETHLGKRLAFEEMVCQLFDEEFGYKGIIKRVRGMQGVEAIVALPDNTVIGIQAKFFDTKRLRDHISQIKRSIEKTQRYYPEVTDWILSIPFQPTPLDSDKWDEKIVKNFPSLRFKIWGQKEISRLLIKFPIYALFWFKDYLEVNSIINLSKKNMRRRKYTREIHVKTHLESSIDIYVSQNLPEYYRYLICQISSIKNKWMGYYEELSPLIDEMAKCISSHEISVPHHDGFYSFSQQKLVSLDIFSALLLEFKEKMDSNNPHLVDDFLEKNEDFYEYSIPMFDLVSYIEDNQSYIYRLESLEKEKPEVQDVLSTPTFKTLRKKFEQMYFDSLNDLDIFSEINDTLLVYFTSLKKGLHIEDRGGTGKSHLLVNLCSNLPKGLPFIFLNGVDFEKKKQIEAQILGQLGLGRDFNYFVKGLISLGKLFCSPIPFIIDGLNESEDFKVWKDLELLLEDLKSPWILPIIASREITIFDYKEYIPNSLAKRSVNILFKDIMEKYSHYFQIQVSSILYSYFTALELWYVFKNAKRLNKKAFVITYDLVQKANEEIIDSLEKKIVEKLDLIPGSNWINKVFYSLVKRILSSSKPRISKSEFDRISRQINIGSTSWTNSLLKFLIEEEILIAYEEDVEFQNQTTQTIAIGRFLKNHKIDHIKLIEMQKPWINEGIKNYITKGGVPLTYQLPILKRIKWKIRRVSQNMVSQLQTIDAEAISIMQTPAEIHTRTLERVFSSSPALRGLIITNLCDRYLFDQNHVFNGVFVTHLLSNENMITRDLLLGEYLRTHSPRIINFLDNLSVPESNTRTDQLVKTLIWFLSSNHRYLRDLSTFTLVKIGVQFPELVFQIVHKYLYLNDLYILERLFAVLYGICSKVEIPSSIQKNIIGLITSKVFAEGKFEHILLRDYAFQILNLLEPEKADMDLFYNVSEEFSVDEKCQGEINRGDPSWGLFDQTIRMDFSKYILGPISQNARWGQRLGIPSLSKTLCQVRQRIKELGYNVRLFKRIDDGIDYERARKEYPIDRWAKKYSWIAFHELIAKRYGKYPEIFDLSDIRYKRDIDPTFPVFEEARLTNYLIDNTGINWNKECQDYSFIGNNRITQFDNSWILLDMDFWGSINGYRLSFEVNSIIQNKISLSKINRFETRIIKISDTYSTEDPTIYFEEEISDRLVWYYNWEGHQNSINEEIYIPQPMPALVRELGLGRIRGSFDWQDDEGQLAIICRAINDQKIIERASIFLIRRDLLEKLLGSDLMLFIHCVNDKIIEDPMANNLERFDRISHYEWGYLGEDFSYYRLYCQHNPPFENK